MIFKKGLKIVKTGLKLMKNGQKWSKIGQNGLNGSKMPRNSVKSCPETDGTPCIRQ